MKANFFKRLISSILAALVLLSLGMAFPAMAALITPDFSAVVGAQTLNFMILTNVPGNYTVQLGTGTTANGNAINGSQNIEGELTIPESVTHNGQAYKVTQIGKKAFETRVRLTGAIKIPNSVTIINENAFRNCSGFSSLDLGTGVETIGSNAFTRCKGLTGTITIPDSVTEIGDSAFSFCFSNTTGITEVVIGKNVTKIGVSTFYDSKMLEKITFKGNDPPVIVTSPGNTGGVLAIPGTTEIFFPTTSSKTADDWRTALGMDGEPNPFTGYDPNPVTPPPVQPDPEDPAPAPNPNPNPNPNLNAPALITSNSTTPKTEQSEPIPLDKTTLLPVVDSQNIPVPADENGHVSAFVTEQEIKTLINSARKQAISRGRLKNGLGLALNLEVPANAQSFELKLDKNAIALLQKYGIQHFDIETSFASFSLNKAAISALADQTDGDVTFAASPENSLPETAQEVVGTRPAFSFSITGEVAGEAVNITNFGKGAVTLGIAYEAQKNENSKKLYGMYINDQGESKKISNSRYDGSSVLFGVNSLKEFYGIGEEKNLATGREKR